MLISVLVSYSVLLRVISCSFVCPVDFYFVFGLLCFLFALLCVDVCSSVLLRAIVGYYLLICAIACSNELIFFGSMCVNVCSCSLLCVVLCY